MAQGAFLDRCNVRAELGAKQLAVGCGTMGCWVLLHSLQGFDTWLQHTEERNPSWDASITPPFAPSALLPSEAPQSCSMQPSRAWHGLGSAAEKIVLLWAGLQISTGCFGDAAPVQKCWTDSALFLCGSVLQLSTAL